MVGKTASTHALRRAAVEVLRNTALKDLGAVQLAQALQYEAHQVLGMSGEVVSSSIDLASIVHSAQKRGNRGLFSETPYIEHPLRNAVRLLRWGCHDQDVVVAAVLHDTIEDGAQQFVSAVARVGREVPELEARAMLSDHIKNAYGPRVLTLVEAVTNDYTTDTQKSQATVEERNQSYCEHVRKTIAGHPGAFLVKLSDFVDNAGGLYHADIPGREDFVVRLARKYLPVVKVFEDEMEQMDLPVAPESLGAIRAQLATTRERLERIMEKY